MKPILKEYVSPIDQLLTAWDAEHPVPSLSQQKEIAKHERIASLRDKADASTNAKSSDIEDFLNGV